MITYDRVVEPAYWWGPQRRTRRGHRTRPRRNPYYEPRPPEASSRPGER